MGEERPDFDCDSLHLVRSHRHSEVELKFIGNALWRPCCLDAIQHRLKLTGPNWFVEILSLIEGAYKEL